MPSDLHPRVRSAGEGEFPEWARAEPERRDHMRRVAGLMESWARARGEAEDEVLSWSAAGILHDALRDAPPDTLRPELEPEWSGWPGALLHGPAAAARIRTEGVDDGELLRAVAYHTVGHAGFGDLGKALYCADFLEPGRQFEREWREELRARLPEELHEVTREVVAARIRYLLDRGRRIFPVTIRFWNRLAGGEGWAIASEVGRSRGR